MTDTITKNDSGPPRSTRKTKLLAIVAGVLVAGGLAVPAAIFGPQMVGIEEPAEQTEANTPAQAPKPANFTEFRHEEAGIALSYPSSWVQLKTDDPQILLLASDGPENSFLLRAVELPNPVGQQELGSAKQLTDQIVGANQTAKMLVEPTRIELGGLPGHWYFYSFQDEASGQPGIHSHYFVFDGKTMLTLVFQTLPAEKFQESAPIFDQITSSFRVL
ncbi:MAG: hypothetical protein ACRDSL_08045 [Pseudonocardiaceae bacterium]